MHGRGIMGGVDDFRIRRAILLIFERLAHASLQDIIKEFVLDMDYLNIVQSISALTCLTGLHV